MIRRPERYAMYIFASDFDGTLNRDGISERDREAIRRFRAAGNLFGFVTGRNTSFIDTLDKADIDADFLLIYSGAYCLTRRGNVIFESRGLTNGVLPELVRYIGETYGTPVTVALGEACAGFHGLFPDGDPVKGYQPLEKLNSYREFTVLYVHCNTEEEAECCAEELTRRYGSTINPLRNGIFIDIPPAGTDKGAGLARYAALMGVPEENVWTAGDNLNDMAMIRRFRGCAVENAHPDLKAAAKGVYPDVASMIEDLCGGAGISLD